MKFYDIGFFCDEKDSGPKAHCHDLQPSGKTILKINTSHSASWEHPSVVFYLYDEQQLVDFKNSVISAFDDYMRRHYGK